MKLLFKQRFFSWFDSYDIYNESGDTVFEVKGQMSWGHCLHIHDEKGIHIGTVREEIFTFLPKFRMYVGEKLVGEIQKEFTFFAPKYHLDCNGWEVQGDLFGWDYQVTAPGGMQVMSVSKQLLNLTDTYVIDIIRGEDALYALMIVLAIDAVNCKN